jgi:two-component system heavy metal sensor histidine kinase CusS
MRRRPISLALRLTLLFVTASTIIFLAFGWIILDSIEEHFSGEDLSELNIIMNSVKESLSGDLSEQDLLHIEDRFGDLLTGHHFPSMYIAGSDGQKIYSSAGPDLSSEVSEFRSKKSNDELRMYSNGGHHYRVLIRRISTSTSIGSSSYTVAVAVVMDYHLRFIEKFRRTLWFMILSSIMLTGLMGWFVVRRGHAPLHSIITQISRISANELNTRLSPETVPSELVGLAISFNGMLERVEESFQRLTNYSADIAHELRTPVANLMTQTQVALTRARSIDEYREVLYSTMEEYERMAQMIGDMLFLAQAENGLFKPDIINVNLEHEISGLFEYYVAWAEERGVTLKLEGHALTVGDRLMLRRALSNLLSNAIRHTPPRQSVRVLLDDSGRNEVTITVENPGLIIAPQHIPRLFDRFYRVDPSRYRDNDGAGLGLAIVKSIIDIHHGTIKVISEQGYTRFYLTLPRFIT